MLPIGIVGAPESIAKMCALPSGITPTFTAHGRSFGAVPSAWTPVTGSSGPATPVPPATQVIPSGKSVIAGSVAAFTSGIALPSHRWPQCYALGRIARSGRPVDGGRSGQHDAQLLPRLDRHAFHRVDLHRERRMLGVCIER